MYYDFIFNKASWIVITSVVRSYFCFQWSSKMVQKFEQTVGRWMVVCCGSCEDVSFVCFAAMWSLSASVVWHDTSVVWHDASVIWCDTSVMWHDTSVMWHDKCHDVTQVSCDMTHVSYDVTQVSCDMTHVSYDVTQVSCDVTPVSCDMTSVTTWHKCRVTWHKCHVMWQKCHVTWQVSQRDTSVVWHDTSVMWCDTSVMWHDTLCWHVNSHCCVTCNVFGGTLNLTRLHFTLCSGMTRCVVAWLGWHFWRHTCDSVVKLLDWMCTMLVDAVCTAVNSLQVMSCNAV